VLREKSSAGEPLYSFAICSPLFDSAQDGVAGLALWLCIDGAEHLLQARNVSFGLGAMFLERGLQTPVMRGLRHLRQGAQDLLLREVNVLQRVVK